MLTLLSALTHLVCMQKGYTALILAAQKGHTDSVKLLLHCGADIEHPAKVIWERNERVKKCLGGWTLRWWEHVGYLC